MNFSIQRWKQLAGLLKEERNMYGEIVDPEYWIEKTDQTGRLITLGPFETEIEAEKQILDDVGSREVSTFDESRLEQIGHNKWLDTDEKFEYEIVEREKEWSDPKLV